MTFDTDDLQIAASDRGITAVNLGRAASPHQDSALARRCQRELREYFRGKRTNFTLSLDLQGTPFQRKVWNALKRVPYGTTITYGELAKRAGSPRAVRAVASAVARNPVGIILPCHRIVPSAGGTGKYAWGADRKSWLINHERSSRAK